MINYVEIGEAPDARHIVKHVNKGKGKNGSKTALTICGKPFNVDDAIIFAQKTSTLMNTDKPAPMCGGCNGIEDKPPICGAQCKATGRVCELDGGHDGAHRNGSTFLWFERANPPYDTLIVDLPQTREKLGRCKAVPTSNGHSNEQCWLPNQHSYAHANERVTWSGEQHWTIAALVGTEANGDDEATPAARAAAVAEFVAKGAAAQAAVDAAIATTYEAPGTPLPVYRVMAPGSIRKSPFNHRKTFTGLDELAASLREKGMISPITVRPIKNTHGQDHELVAGERRWRAAQIAKMPAIPCIVRELSDKEVLEIQLVENVQRVDVHPLEEADGYRDLIDKHGHDVDSIAAKTGKSKATIYARLKLCALAPGPRKAFLEDKLNASIALLIARIPDPKLQEQATKEVLGQVVDEENYNPSEPLNPERRDLVIDPDKDVVERQPMSVREAQVHLQRRYMLRLELARFDITATTLVMKAGACTTCPKRTGNQRELFSDVKSADVCTDPTCFETKTKAAFEEKAAEAATEGIKVIPANEVKKVFDQRGEVARASPYVDPKAAVPWDLTGDYSGKGKSWEQMLGKKLAADVPKVIVQNPDTGAAHELIDKKAALEKLREAGKIDKAERSSGSSSSSSTIDWEKRRAEDEKKRTINRAARTESTRLAMDAANKLAAKYELPWWRWIAAELLDDQEHDSPPVTLALGYEPNARGAEWKQELIDKLDTVPKARAFVTGCFFYKSCPFAFDSKQSEEFKTGAKLLGVDWTKHLEAAKKNAKEAEKAEKAIAAAKKSTPKKKKTKK